MLPNAITTGAELEDSPGAEQDEHLNDELDVMIQVSGQEDATVEVRMTRIPVNQALACLSPPSLRPLDEAIEFVDSLGVLTFLPARTRDTLTLTGGSRRSTPKWSSQSTI